MMVWLGLGMMSIQVGVMAHLTWFAYSWDIVEPISYFVSYSAVIGVYAYFVLTRKVICSWNIKIIFYRLMLIPNIQEYDYESASDRVFLRNFHKNAIKSNLDIEKYNQIKNSIYSLENNLKKLRESQLKLKETDQVIKP